MKLNLTLSAFALVLTSLTTAQAATQQEMLMNLDFIGSVFKSSYAPADWKKSYAGWDLDTELGKVRDRVASSSLSTREFQDQLQNFFLSAKDYHTSITFQTTESSILPFTVRSAEGKFFLVYIDRAKLPESSFPFALGDELVSFGGQKVEDVVHSLEASMGGNSPLTDRAIAEVTLTMRSRRFDLGAIPRGPITLGLRHKGTDKVISYQLIWDYKPELIKPHLMSARALNRTPETGNIRRSMTSPFYQAFQEIAADHGLAPNPQWIGTKKSYIPALGKKIWEAPADSEFEAYIYQNDAGKLIGYVRIPSYVPSDADKAANEFRELMAKYEAFTDGLVIDQINNPGGSVYYLYALAAALSEQSLSTPSHKMTITQEDVSQSIQLLAKLGNVSNDEQARKALGESEQGYPVSYEYARFQVEFARFIIDQWNAGKHVTDNYPLGIDRINPAEEPYTKPVLLLVNALDFSGGDFFPAILQDNKRVTILGTRTSGAGGYVLEVTYPNQIGVANFHFTGSIAKRADTNPIENLGVTPDIEYMLTAQDLTSNYSGYVKKINDTISGLVSSK